MQTEVFPTTNLLDAETVQKLNGYTKETANGKKHFLGTAEISQMFESATPELLRKIAGVIAEHGCKDEKKWIQKSPWYREFELGREAERQLKRGNGRDKRLRQDLTLLNITGIGNVRQCCSFTKTP